ncbi:helical backbone metal receptor [Tepidiforma sp.]|uniref:helical backbone metal receptor n=1 Tax=Tepidiforma sp. TaxID=2682230 RepID=UPI002639DAE9|nr:helical backbone metal receptor [Tepidiforma sp.]MCX7617938.1 helical backbone metal receptor [Tepidiforma sp.]
MTAMRLVSLVPSLTELVWALDPGALAGRTRFCTEPREMAARVPAFGGTKDPDIAGIAALRPDLVVANREENRREDVEALEARGLRVMVTAIDSVEEALGAIAEIGRALGRAAEAAALTAGVREVLAEPLPGPPVRVFVPIWRKPLLGLGGRTYGSSVLEAAGAVNVLAGRERYPEVTLEEAAALRPELVLLPDEPYRFREEHAAEFAAVAPARLVDGKLLWWYGPRMAASLRELRRLLAGVRA